MRSHGHFDHTAGLSGLIGQLGPAVLIHSGFWAWRRLAIPAARRPGFPPPAAAPWTAPAFAGSFTPL